MPQIFAIDQANTFSGVAFVQSVPKTVFGQPDVKDTTQDGRIKWEIRVICAFKDQFGNDSHEILKVNVASHTDPGEGLVQYTPIQLVGLVVGIIPAEMSTDRNGAQKVKGGTSWFRAESIQPLNGAPTGGRRSASTES